MQTLLQAIHLSNHEYRFPPAPKPKHPESPQPQPQPQPAQPPVNCPSSLATHHSPLPQAPQPAPSPHTPLPPHERRIRPARSGQSSNRAGSTTRLRPAIAPRASTRRNAESLSQSHIPATRRNSPKLSFRAQRGICFFLFPHPLSNFRPSPTNARFALSP